MFTLPSCDGDLFCTLTYVYSIAPSPSQPARAAPDIALAGPHDLRTAVEAAVEMAPFEHEPFRRLLHHMGLP